MREHAGKMVSYAAMADEKIKEGVRVFFALWPSDAERAALAAWQPALHKQCGGRIIRADTLHNTLVFIGNIGPHRLEALRLAAQEAGGEGFRLKFAEARYWRHNRIVYAAPDSTPPELARLVRQLEQRLAAHRFDFDTRPYQPHVTLLRNAAWGDAPLPEMGGVTWRANEFALVQSAPDEHGANYRVLARFPLRLS
jgi:2'-5' RNA ligase